MANKLIERIIRRGKLVALIVRQGYRLTGLQFFSEPSASQQIGMMEHPSDYIIQRHIHKRIERRIINTSETFIVQAGLVEAEIYDNTKKLIKTVTLKRGDLISFVSGGHGFKFLKRSRVIEIKQGPYLPLGDKERF